METILCCDFDGVLCDSIAECLVTGFNAFYHQKIFSPQDAGSTLQHFFYAHRHLVRPAQEFYLLFYAYEHGIQHLDENKIFILKHKLADAIKNFAKNFYQERDCLMQNLEHWLKLHKLYPESQTFLKQGRRSFYIVTNKNLQAVTALARYFGFEERIISIYSKEIALDKRILFETMFTKEKFDPSSRHIIFIDDSEAHLEDIDGLGLDLGFAAWGYSRKLKSNKFKLIHNLDSYGLT